MLALLLCLAFSIANSVEAQIKNANASGPPNSFPHGYPGIPNHEADFHDSRAWQEYFYVKYDLPNITFPLTRSYAGNIPVNRKGHPNDTLFFWAFEKTDGSLTREACEDENEPWIIWLNGGPGASSMVGLLFENGPLHLASDLSMVENEFTWNTLADMVWIDQPVGTGFSTADSSGYISNEDDMGRDFLGFLSNFVQVFPSLAKRPLYLMGESYAGTYIPYITKTYFSMLNPPVNLVKFAIGDGNMGADTATEDASVISIIETYPQLIDYDPEVYEYFKEQHHLCGYDLTLTYPQEGHFPTLRPHKIGGNGGTFTRLRSVPRQLFHSLSGSTQQATKLSLVRRENFMGIWNRDLSDRANGTIDPWYQCFLLFELLDYALNFTKPWSVEGPNAMFDVYDIPDALNPPAPPDALRDASFFFNHPQTRAALHAPTSKNWSAVFPLGYPFENNQTNNKKPGTNGFGDPSVEPMAFLTELATNSSAMGIKWVLYSGNDDLILPHFGTEVTIQNTTFGGIQGFTRKPSTPWFGDDGEFAGIVHQERNITFVLFDNAGHLVPQTQPARALTFLREFVLGCNPNGTVIGESVIGGEDHPLPGGIIPGEHNPIFTGSGSTMGSTLWPSATIAAWDSFIASATAG